MGCQNCAMNGANDAVYASVSSSNKLNSYDWLNNLPDTSDKTDIVEVRFKNTRKEFYRNVHDISLKVGDTVVVEGNPGVDVGRVSLTGQLVLLQIKKRSIDFEKYEINKIYRKANPTDIEKWKEAKMLENSFMLKARKIASNLKLDMKIGDVEVQGDKTKAIFYYFAEARIDFRQLIKVFAEEFRVKIEMKQIGARQEAARIGGIGSCGRELCCSSWRTNFDSVSTTAARVQGLSQNAQKLTGQCGKLKCCIMYELDSYIEAKKDFPMELLELETDKGVIYPIKTNVLRKLIWYSLDKNGTIDLVPITTARVKEIIMMNKKGIKTEMSTVNEFSL